MKYDEILPRLTPDADFDFDTTPQTVMSRKAEDKGRVERTYESKVFDDYNKIIWNDTEIAKPTPEECQDEWDKMQVEESSNEVMEKRKTAILEKYPIHVQLEAITEYHAGRPDKLNAMAADIEDNIKPMYPKN